MPKDFSLFFLTKSARILIYLSIMSLVMSVFGLIYDGDNVKAAGGPMKRNSNTIIAIQLVNLSYNMQFFFFVE